LPSSFRTAERVAKIAEKPVPNVSSSEEDSPSREASSAQRVCYRGPQRVLRTAVSSMACSEDFGPMMQREARRRRFYEAALGAFLGDGLAWNWTIWKLFFPTFVPILDFIHAIQYLYAAAMAAARDEAAGWADYLRLATLCWQGQVQAAIERLAAACRERGIDPQQRLADDDPCKPLVDAVRYLSNNARRMDYPRYRRLGLPVTSAPMESLIKQLNQRVKGTEMFWDDPAGAEAILQVRAAALSDDDRLGRYLARRPGQVFVRRPPTPKTAA